MSLIPFEDWQLSQVMGKKSKLLGDLIPLQKETKVFMVKSTEKIGEELVNRQEPAKDLDNIFDIIETQLEKATKDDRCYYAKYEVFEYIPGNPVDPKIDVVGPIYSYIFQRDA
jgi:hypothetical protein